MKPTVNIIGAGPGGCQAALRLAQLGAQVNLMERDAVGGTCLNWGCIPTKALKATADCLEMAKRGAEFGLTGLGSPAVDLPRAMARKNQVVEVNRAGVEKLLAAWGVRLIMGKARVVSANLVEVETPKGEVQGYRAGKLLVASGAKSAGLPGLVRDGLKIMGSDDALCLTQAPGRLLVVGGGVVGCEFAQIFAAFGSQVTIVEALDRLLPLPGLDPATSKLLLREMKKRRIKAHLEAVVSSCQADGKEVTLQLGPSPLVENSRFKLMELKADLVLLAVGRKPAGDQLGLENAGVTVSGRGLVPVDQRLATVNPDVYAIGDCLGAGRPMLAHMATAEALAAAENILGGNRRVDYRVVPSVAFTSPETAWVGMSQAEAKSQGIDAVAHEFPFRQLGKAQAMGEIAGQSLLVSEDKTGRLLGAQIIGPHAADLIHECALALKMGATIDDLAHTIHAHPTLAEGVAEAAHLALGACLHAPPGGKA